MIRLTCSVSLRSRAAMIFSIVPTASAEMTAVSRRASSASVRTADSTASLAASDRGLNSFWSSCWMSELSTVLPWPSACSWVAIVDSPLSRGLGLGLGLRLALGGLRGGGQCLEQRRVLEHLPDQLLGPRLTVHVREEVGQLLARLQQLAQGVHLAGDGGRGKVVHALE